MHGYQQRGMNLPFPVPESECRKLFPTRIARSGRKTRFSWTVWVILSAFNAPAIVLGPNGLSATWLKQRHCFYSIPRGWVGRFVRQENEGGQHTTNGGSKGYTYRMMGHRVRIDVVVPAMCSTSPRAILVLPHESQTVHHHTKLTEFAKQIVSKFTRKDVHRKKSMATSEQV